MCDCIFALYQVSGAEAVAAKSKRGRACNSVLPPPFFRSTGMDAANAAFASSSLAEGLFGGGGSTLRRHAAGVARMGYPRHCTL